jgi:hypothetical protein
VAIIKIESDYADGEVYLSQLNDEANKNFQILLLLLSSYFQSRIDGPNYTRELKAIAIELSRIRISLEQVRTDINFKQTRGEFLYQVITSLLFPNGAPDTGKPDQQFRDFLNEIIKIYFQGSIPASIQKAVELLTNNSEVRVTANVDLSDIPNSGFDISDQFGFQVDVFLNLPPGFDIFKAEQNIKILLDIIRPAHTLYRLRYILRDGYLGQQQTGPNVGDVNSRLPKIRDALRMKIENYYYEDFRKFVEGVEGIDELGFKKSKSVIFEDHSHEF